MAISCRYLLCAILASVASAQVVSNSSSTASTSTVVSSSSAIISTSSTPSSSTVSSRSTTVSISSTPSTSTVVSSSTAVISSTSSAPLSSSSTSTRPASTSSSASSSSPSATSTTPSNNPSSATSLVVTTSSTAVTSFVTTSRVISSTETSTVASPSATASTSAALPSSSSSSIPPPSTSTATSRSSASSTSNAPSSSAAPPPTSSTQSSSARSRTESSSSKATESSAYVFSSVSSSVIQSTVISTNAVIITTQGDNGQLTQRTSYTVVQTTVPATTLYATTVVTSTESPTGIAGLQAQALNGSNSDNLSTGAKAGIGAGVAVLVIAAAVFGALFAMRRRRKNNNRIAENDRYPPSSNPSFFGVGALGKRNSRFTESEIHSSHSPPMREADPLDRYAIPGMSASGKGTIPANSRTSDISSMSGSEPTTYRPGPGMPVVAEYNRNHGTAEELHEQHRYRSGSYAPPVGYSEASGNPFHEKSGNQTPSLYSNDGDDAPRRYPSQRQASPAALELSGENTLVSSLSQSSGGYRGMDPEQPYHTRSQLTKPLSQQRQFDPSHNF